MKIGLFVHKIHQFEPNTGKNIQHRCDPIQSPLLRISTPIQLDWPSHTCWGSTLWGMEGRSWYQTFWLSKKKICSFSIFLSYGKNEGCSNSFDQLSDCILDWIALCKLSITISTESIIQRFTANWVQKARI